MAFHPCCRLIKLEAATKFVAGFHIVEASLRGLAGIFLMLVLVSITISNAEGDQRFYIPPEKAYELVANTAFFLIVGIFGVILGVVLYQAASSRNISKCFWPMIFLYFKICVDLMYLITELVGDIHGINVPIIIGAYIFLESYFLCVVYAFMQEIKRCPQSGENDQYP